ncbi:MAG: hypothetical protein P4L87_11240 [Formivibrio sp.]|nr:hypothetical protein [Formivibrio sp.]
MSMKIKAKLAPVAGSREGLLKTLRRLMIGSLRHLTQMLTWYWRYSSLPQYAVAGRRHTPEHDWQTGYRVVATERGTVPQAAAETRPPSCQA